ncbi:nitroreductase [Flavobacteriaceae bacterium R38]|nr:nitroreductase [Flavobacteriaceae bacterium R38]
MKNFTVSELIQNRKSVFPPLYIKKEIPKGIIEEMLENANRAPTHKLTQPWRFKVVRGEGKSRLGDFLALKYKELFSDTSFSERKYKKLKENPVLADTIIAIIMQRDVDESLPEWEEVAAVSMAVQNMWLTASAHNIGSYWSSPGLIKYANEFFDLKEGEKCLGFFYMGYYEAEIPTSKREAIATKVEWIEE